MERESNVSIFIGNSESKHFKLGDILTVQKADEMLKKYDIKKHDGTYDKVNFSINIDKNSVYQGRYYLGEETKGFIKKLENNCNTMRSMNENGLCSKKDIENLEMLENSIIPQLKKEIKVPESFMIKENSNDIKNQNVIIPGEKKINKKKLDDVISKATCKKNNAKTNENTNEKIKRNDTLER